MHPRRAYLALNLGQGLFFGSIAPTYAMFLRGINLSYSDISLLNAAFWGSITLLELPTGMLADGKSRAWSVRIGCGAMSLGAIAYFRAHDFSGALACELLIGVGHAFISGAQGAWITDALDKRGETSERRSTFAYAAAARSFGVLGGSLVGAYLGTHSLRYPWLAGFLCICFATYAAIFWMKDDGEPQHRVTELEAFRQSHEKLRGSPNLIWCVAVATAFGLVLPFNHFWAPFFNEQVDATRLGLIWIPLYGTLTAANLLTRRTGIGPDHEPAGISLSLLAAGLGLALLPLGNGLAAPLLFGMLHEFGRGLFAPRVEVYLQRHIESSHRATFGSLQSMIERAGNAFVLLAVWLGTKDLPSNRTTIDTVWKISGSLLILCAFLAWTRRPKAVSQAQT